ncbi:PTS sugar transporter subunit IIA [Erysipelothrix tonsillarum]|uniref:PTS sugar transporter subunit IIA n=1 Tax=Erysipelothrix tonsillarum TaxID=38402 RepID=UPI00036675F1|nr:PTS sugar transporter subunit IIA [Erysipelothrix tonsillarum]
MFNEDLIFLDLKVSSQDELFNVMNHHLLELGYVNEAYLDALKEREATYPTGLAAPVCSVAIPHVDSRYIHKPGIAFVRVAQPIAYKEMVSDNDLEVKLFFFLLVKNKDEQVQILSKLMGTFADDDFLNQLLQGKTNKEILDILAKGVA